MDKQITIRMPKELLANWLAALRSGEFLQGTKALKDDDGRYCCLGVLQHVAGTDVVVGATLPAPGWLAEHGITHPDGSYFFLPTLGTSATNANDGEDELGDPIQPRTFPEIADAIEACAEGV